MPNTLIYRECNITYILIACQQHATRDWCVLVVKIVRILCSTVKDSTSIVVV